MALFKFLSVFSIYPVHDNMGRSLEFLTTVPIYKNCMYSYLEIETHHYINGLTKTIKCVT